MAADDAGAWGLRPQFVVVDEFAQWPTTQGSKRLWYAITSAVPKVAGCRLVILTTAGDPVHYAHDVLVQAHASPRWRVPPVPRPRPRVDPGPPRGQKAEPPGSQDAPVPPKSLAAPPGPP